MNAPEQPSPEELGERLRLARENASLTQAEAAQRLGVARTTLLAIEKGQRRVRMEELQQLAKLYGTSANQLLRREAVHLNLAPRFRKTFNARDEAVQAAARLLGDLVEAELELENLLGIRRVPELPPERPLRGGDIRQQAAYDALELRSRIGIGIQPVLDMVTLLEFEFGVRMFVRKLDSRIDGLFAYDESVGACMLLNIAHRRERRNLTAAHELGHLVASRHSPEVLLAEFSSRSPEERYATAFAPAFLMPAPSLTQRFREVTAGADLLTRRHVIVLSHTFGVSREALVHRLEELGLAPNGTWDWFLKDGGITDKQVAQVLGELGAPPVTKTDLLAPATLRLNILAGAVYQRQLLSEGQLAKLLRLDRRELRELLGDVEGMGEEADGAPLLPR